MARRVIDWIAHVMRAPHAEPQPHFHRGPWSEPAACYDPNCSSPRLDV